MDNKKEYDLSVGHRIEIPDNFEKAEYDSKNQEVVFTQGHMGYGKGKTNDIADVHTCSICQGPYTGYGHNAQPVNAGRCCGQCNKDVVLPARHRRMDKGLKPYDGGLDRERVERIAQAVLDGTYKPSDELPPGNYHTEEVALKDLRTVEDEEDQSAS